MKAALFVFVLLISVSGVSGAVINQDHDTPAIDAYIARQAHLERGEEYKDARKVATGDLNHDGDPETVVLYTIEGQGGSNNHVQYLAVFTRRGGKLMPLATTPVGGRVRRSVENITVEDGAIRLETLGYGPKDAACCPSVKGKTSYVLAGRTLREQKAPARRRAV